MDTLWQTFVFLWFFVLLLHPVQFKSFSFEESFDRSVLENVQYVLEKNVYYGTVRWNVLCMSRLLIQSTVYWFMEFSGLRGRYGPLF